jgi:hypothetical protein
VGRPHPNESQLSAWVEAGVAKIPPPRTISGTVDVTWKQAQRWTVRVHGEVSSVTFDVNFRSAYPLLCQRHKLSRPPASRRLRCGRPNATQVFYPVCARNLYGWQCAHENMAEVNRSLDGWGGWSTYPESRPRVPGEKRPLGVVPLTPEIERNAKKRLARIRADLIQRGRVLSQGGHASGSRKLYLSATSKVSVAPTLRQ